MCEWKFNHQLYQVPSQTLSHLRRNVLRLFAQKQYQNLNLGWSDSKYHPLCNKPTCFSTENCPSSGKCVRVKQSRKSARQVRAYIWLTGREQEKIRDRVPKWAESWSLAIARGCGPVRRPFYPQRIPTYLPGAPSILLERESGRWWSGEVELLSHKCKCSGTQEHTWPREWGRSLWEHGY